MKKVIAMLFAAALSATALQAQDKIRNHDNKSPEEKAKMKTERLDKKLDLTDNQEAKVEQIFLTSAQKMAQLKAQKGNDKKAMGQEFKAIRENTNQQLKAVLTADQWAKKEKLEAERKEKHKERKSKGHQKGKHKNGSDYEGKRAD